MLLKNNDICYRITKQLRCYDFYYFNAISLEITNNVNKRLF
jgi:hypothetical protein